MLPWVRHVQDINKGIKKNMLKARRECISWQSQKCLLKKFLWIHKVALKRFMADFQSFSFNFLFFFLCSKSSPIKENSQIYYELFVTRIRIIRLDSMIIPVVEFYRWFWKFNAKSTSTIFYLEQWKYCDFSLFKTHLSCLILKQRNDNKVWSNFSRTKRYWALLFVFNEFSFEYLRDSLQFFTLMICKEHFRQRFIIIRS